mmetsp:Transcript_70096/g.183725  ORF Transcript_70096/g.183725 Transcript_70096/m.183725 type:complete len:224 (-) Transcript_70096:2-673(-)
MFVLEKLWAVLRCADSAYSPTPLWKKASAAESLLKRGIRASSKSFISMSACWLMSVSTLSNCRLSFAFTASLSLASRLRDSLAKLPAGGPSVLTASSSVGLLSSPRTSMENPAAGSYVSMTSSCSPQTCGAKPRKWTVASPNSNVATVPTVPTGMVASGRPLTLSSYWLASYRPGSFCTTPTLVRTLAPLAGEPASGGSAAPISSPSVRESSASSRTAAPARR